MTIREIKDALDEGKVQFGIRQALKKPSKGKSKTKVFVAKDTRKETLDKLKKANIDFIELKSKEDISRELNLGFESEVFSLR